MTISNKDLIITRNYIVSFLNANTDNTSGNWKLKNRTLASLAKSVEKFNDELDDLQCDHCCKGERGEMLIRDGQRTYTAEGHKLLKRAIKVLEEKSIEIDIKKALWEKFTDTEKSWFDMSDEHTLRIMQIFIEGVPQTESDKD